MKRLKRSWSIFRKSMSLIKKEPKLLIFPLFSFLSILFLALIIITGGVMFFMSEGGQAVLENASQASSGEETAVDLPLQVEIPVLFVLYLVTMFLSSFCLTAFYSEIIQGLHGGTVSIKRGFQYALHRIQAIFLWSMLASTIGVILNLIQEKAGWAGSLAAKLIGLGWNIAACFVIPTIVCNEETSNPITILKRSAQTIKRTWGESLIGFAGLGAISGIAVLIWLFFTAAIIIPAFSIGNTGLWTTVIILSCGGFFLLCAAFYLTSVAKIVYLAALYLYAEGKPVDTFSQEEMLGAFKQKKIKAKH